TDGRFRGARAARHDQIHCGGLFWAQRDFKAQRGRRDLSRNGVTPNPCLPDNFIQTFVGQKNRIALNAIFQSVSSFFAARASYFENIGEICSNRQLERNTYRRTSIIDDLELFVADIAPKKFGTQNVDGAALDDYAVTVGDIDIRKVCGEDEILGLDGGTQQQRPGVPQAKT